MIACAVCPQVVWWRMTGDPCSSAVQRSPQAVIAEEDVAELQEPLVREEVVVADGLVRVGAALDDSVVEEVVEPLGEYLAGDAEVALEIVEAADPDEEVSEDEWGPGLAGDVEAARDGAGHLAEGGSLHPSIVTKLL